MRYISIFIAFALCFAVNLNANIFDVFSNENNIHYSTLNKITNSYILNNNIVSSNLFVVQIGNNEYYNVTYSPNLKYIEDDNGNNMVLFPNNSSFVRIDNYDNTGLNDENINSFTIEFFLKPYVIRMNSAVLSKTSIYNDNGIIRSSGIRANIINGRLVWQFNNIFKYNGEYTNVTFTGGEYLKENEWKHHSVSYDGTTGKFVNYIDGLEEEIIYLTSTGDKMGSPYILDINHIKLYPFYLGRGFIGEMNSFNFHNNYIQNYNLYKYTTSGEIVSKVIDFKNENIFIDSINYTGSSTNGAYIDLFYRTSNNYFMADDTTISWQPLSIGMYDNNFSYKLNNQNSTSYIQIKAILKSNIDRNITPILNNVNIEYHYGIKPYTPTNLTVTALKDNRVMLKWSSSHENITGYKIYYGIRPGIYNDALYTPIMIDNQNEFYIDGLNDGEVYYFTITAIGGEDGNIESDFSKEVYVRVIK